MKNTISKILIFLGKKLIKWGDSLAKPSLEDLTQQLQTLSTQLEESQKEINDVVNEFYQTLSTLENGKNEHREL